MPQLPQATVRVCCAAQSHEHQIYRGALLNMAIGPNLTVCLTSVVTEDELVSIEPTVHVQKATHYVRDLPHCGRADNHASDDMMVEVAIPLDVRGTCDIEC